ncbi:MAG: DNA replication protein [Alyxoria varia]|nr:MAG: DNA replication protein [Alyxoria varia]
MVSWTKIKQGTKVELPLWLAEMLAVSQSIGSSPMATIDMPSALSTRVLNALKADPRTVDLRAQAPHFYSLGVRMLELFEEDEMAEVLAATLRKRAAEIHDHANNPRGGLGGDGGTEFLRGLDETERQLFRAAHDSSKATRTWLADVQKKS